MTNPPGTLEALSLEDCRKMLEVQVNTRQTRGTASLLHYNLSLLEHLKDAERWQALMKYESDYLMTRMPPEELKILVDAVITQEKPNARRV